MPIGSSKLGVLGAGLVPGGSVTFNASGTWAVPPGVKKVSITGRGGTGNPGNPGNPGNAGNPGSGGGGGGASTNRIGGSAFNSGPLGAINQLNVAVCWTNLPAPNPLNPRVVKGGKGPSPNIGAPGQNGNSGSAGSGGNAGSAGNAGQLSSGLGNNFAGGAAGNAGAAGSAGNGGSGGNAGQGGSPGPFPLPGAAGGNGGGSGGINWLPPSPGSTLAGGNGGGGAGATNDGQAGSTTTPVGVLNPGPGMNNFCNFPANVSSGGNDANACAMATLNPRPVFPWTYRFPTNGGVNLAGGNGAPICPSTVLARATFATAWGPASEPLLGAFPYPTARLPQLGARFNNTPVSSNIWRAGGGGAASVLGPCIFDVMRAAGGGGRGNAGNAGNAGGAGGTGGAGSPQTFNCVPVTPGGTTPITVASPGGQIVISWNPQ